MPEVTVEMPWIPNLTGNHCYMQRGSRRFMRPEVATWKSVLYVKLREALEVEGGCIARSVGVQVDWYGPRQPDQDNRCKVVFDAVEMATGINDRNFVMMPGGYERATYQEAKVVVKLRWGEEKP